MAKFSKVKLVRPEFLASAKALRMRRAELGLTQEALAARTQIGKSADCETAVSQRTVSDVERAYTGITNLSAARVVSYIVALEWTPQEFAQATALNYPHDYGKPPTTLEATRRFEVQDTHITFRVYAGISAGHEEAEPIEGEAFSIPSGDLSGIDLTCVRVYRVNGDCMVSDSARGLTMNICSGDKIAVDISQRLVNNNDVIAAYWRPGDKLVVKRYVEAGDHIVLKPTSPAHPPLIAQNNDDFEIIGKVVWRGGPYRA